MITKNGIILLEEDDLGVDMNKIYQKAFHYDKRLPEFDDIYDSYKIEVMQKNLDEHVKPLKEQIARLRSEVPFEKLEELQVKELPTLDTVELQFYLNRKFYSYAAGKDVFNSPIKEVW
ncbi:hypothetical protein [Priestia megaterium]|uniref:hypothetical protein n=1 Tax=Priestia megaterium TaxID=1404 RepID=UPI000BFE1673|nr:hypothetical protein [Priestia megaterium]PGQ88224.1 hypothetical protein COA18_04675 [Priestia megaterium]